MVDVDITWLIDKLLWKLQLSPLMAFQILAIIYQNYVDYPRPSQPTSLQETAGPSRACLQTSDPLRILFCGSDEFSIAHLKALHAYHLKQPERVSSIDVVCRPGKRVGRGLKQFREG
ncbi:uncharacterized protein N7525_000193 [Penicillium rubens]|uniref:uncharacterized protein n=1 Tax=Penicillium rubens TaxID=1108849 RepID=UPI002A5AACCC|nr:uncharacterized protein N7525_000193 [Penicillium rubens]KAJ5842452.1 hypothetical protein N7525_000193 [Penicillium rubens]